MNLMHPNVFTKTANAFIEAIRQLVVSNPPLASRAGAFFFLHLSPKAKF